MKSRLYNQFYKNSYEIIYPEIQDTYLFKNLKDRLNIFTTPSKRVLLVKQKLDYIFKNFDLANIPIVMSDKIKTPKYTKDGVAMFPSQNEEKNFFDAAYIITEITLIEFVQKKRVYDDLFASMYVKVIEKMFKLNFNRYNEVFPDMDLNLFEMIYNDFTNRKAWELIYNKFSINLNDMEYKSIDLGEHYKFTFEKFEVLINVYLNKKIKVFLIRNK